MFDMISSHVSGEQLLLLWPQSGGVLPKNRPTT